MYVIVPYATNLSFLVYIVDINTRVDTHFFE